MFNYYDDYQQFVENQIKLNPNVELENDSIGWLVLYLLYKMEL
jgi:hypothetical protein